MRSSEKRARRRAAETRQTNSDRPSGASPTVKPVDGRDDHSAMVTQNPAPNAAAPSTPPGAYRVFRFG